MGSASSRRPKELSASGDGGCVAACWRPRRRRRRKEEVGEERETAPSFSRSDEDEDGRPAPPPTPSSGEAVETPLAVSSQERLLQLISCFPFPTPRGTPQMTPQLARRNSGTTTWDEMTTAGRKGVGGLSTLGRLVQVSVDTMAITALPIDCWLRERLKSWVQLSGHEGSIVPATKNTLYKKQTEARTEGRAYAEIVKDSALEGCTPRFHKEIEKNDESFIEIEDLLAQFADPTNTAIMDIKIGTRTFLEAEVSNGKKRKDLYEKMVEMDPNEPTAEERQEGAITKMRYMMFRERESSSAQLGFRIEAAKLPGGSLEKNFKKVKTPPQILDCMSKFFGSTRVQIAVLQRLRHIRSAVERSWFFATHEVVGSSLLIMHDEVNVGVWMIDFAKATRITEARILTHRKPWQLGNCEDGYLVGIDNLIQSDERLKEHAR